MPQSYENLTKIWSANYSLLPSPVAGPFEWVIVDGRAAVRSVKTAVSPRDSHENLPAIGGGTQVADFCRGKTKGISKNKSGTLIKGGVNNSR